MMQQLKIWIRLVLIKCVLMWIQLLKYMSGCAIAGQTCSTNNIKDVDRPLTSGWLTIFWQWKKLVNLVENYNKLPYLL